MGALKRAVLRGLATGLCLLVAPASAQLLTYTENDESCPGCLDLGYPVPVPVDSGTPGDYFRAYAALDQQLTALALSEPDVRRQLLGQTLQNRDIPIYLLGDANSVRHEGLIPEAAILQNGGVHAREWASPEVVAGIIEELAAHAEVRGLHRFLLDNLNILIIPVLNVDGYLQTQRFPTQALRSEDGDVQRTGDTNYPRDGRMRRKNMRDTDEQLDLNGDGMNGVDLNRNNPPFWANSAPNRSSFRAGSIEYHGAGVASEPETAALQAAAGLGPAERLRLYIDTHSFRRSYYAPYTHNARRNALQDRLVNRMRQVPPRIYNYEPSGPGGEIGATDEYFAYSFQIPSYTLELEPGPSGSADYGGSGVSHDGFILPEAELARVRREQAAASLLGYYHQAGPPSLLAVEVRAVADDTLVLDSRWTPDSPSTRSLQQRRPTALQAGVDYRLHLQFDKPMRVRDALGQVRNYSGQAVPLAPTVRLLAAFSDGRSETRTLTATPADWLGALGAHYDDDSLQLEFSMPADWAPDSLRTLELQVSVRDLAGQDLDANPATVVDWQAGAWQGYENTAGQAGDVGGEDRNHRLIEDDSPPPAPAAGGGGGRLPGSACLLLMLAAIRRRIHLNSNKR